VLSAIGLIKSEAQIIINVPLGQTLNYGALSGSSYTFRGAGRINLNANNTAVTGAVIVEGVNIYLGSTNSALSNISNLTIRNGASVIVSNPAIRNRLSDYAPISLDGGHLIFTHLPYSTNAAATGERIGTIHLLGGGNSLEIRGDSVSPYRYSLTTGGIVRGDIKSTLYLHLESGMTASPSNPIWYNSISLIKSDTLPEMINGIMPYSVIRFLYRSIYNTMDSIYFSHSEWNGWDGKFDIHADFSQGSSQDTWGSDTLNVSISANQTLNANRTINSLRLVDNHAVNLNGYTLSVNAGAFLTARANRQQWIENGTLTTAQNRYFFHIYGTRLSVSSNISGGGKELVKSGPGELVFYGNQSNAYTGTTYIHEGTLVLSKSPNAKAVGNIIVGDGGGTDTLRLDQSHQIDDLATVRLKGASRAKNMTAQGVLQFNGAGGIGLTEKIHTLEVEGQGVINFAGGTLARPNVLETTRVLLPTADDTLFIRNWIEYEDYFLVTRAFAPNAVELARIWFEGWQPGAKLRDYNASHWEIVPYGSPEPATYGAILGAVGLGLWSWRRKRRKPSD